MTKQFHPGQSVTVEAGMLGTKFGTVQRIAENTIYVKHFDGMVVGYKPELVSEQAAKESVRQSYSSIADELSMIQAVMEGKNQSEQPLQEEWKPTGKTAKHMKTGETTYEYAKVDKEGRQTGDRHYRNADGKVMGEEVEGIDEAYTGKNPHAIKSVGSSTEKGVMVVTTNAGATHKVSAKDTGGKMPKIGDHISKYVKEDAAQVDEARRVGSDMLARAGRKAIAAGKAAATEKEKDLAAAAHPKDKITHKDVLVKRGVFEKESVDNKMDIDWHYKNIMNTKGLSDKAKKDTTDIYNKLKKDKERGVSEETYQIDELSKKTLSSYVKAAAQDAEQAGRDQEYHGHSSDYQRGVKRQKGISKAVDRLAKEETDLSEESGRHKVQVTVSDPSHELVHKRKEQMMKHVIVTAGDKDTAVSKAKTFYKKKGYKVHDAEYHSAQPAVKEEAELDEDAKSLKPGWMLKADPALGAKVKAAQELAKKRQASYGDPSAGKSVKEEVEQIDELSKGTLSSYMSKSQASKNDMMKDSDHHKLLARKGSKDGQEYHSDKHNEIESKIAKRSAGWNNAYDRMKKEEADLDEAAAQTVGDLKAHHIKMSEKHRAAMEKATDADTKSIHTRGMNLHKKATESGNNEMSARANEHSKSVFAGTASVPGYMKPSSPAAYRKMGSRTVREESELDEASDATVYDKAEKHKQLADAAKKSGNMFAHHMYMADFHDGISQWHTSKGRHGEADKHAVKAEDHQELAMKHKAVAEQIDEEMISYSDFMSKVAAHKKAGNTVTDHKYTDKKASYTTVDQDGMGRTVTHTPAGSKVENHGKMTGQDDEGGEKKTTEKRGRGRPAGSKSGARH